MFYTAISFFSFTYIFNKTGYVDTCFSINSDIVGLYFFSVWISRATITVLTRAELQSRD
jgi:hypothetical protein